jgi:NADH dehydrogenase
MVDGSLQAVTGAFGYSGRYIAQRLLNRGLPVVTLTNTRPRRDPFQGRVRAAPLDFASVPTLAESLRGVDVLYNTYWVRFDHGEFSHGAAVRNTKRLFRAAVEGGVRRIVHVSITNPSLESSLPYFRGKAELEQALVTSGVSYAILRPTVLFGREDVLINNIAWMLRRFPVFAMPGDGRYRLQPIYVDDLAGLAVSAGGGHGDSVTDAIGPETFTYRELVEIIGESIGSPRTLVSAPPWLVHGMGHVLGVALRDVVITRDEIQGLMEERLYVQSPPAGSTRLSEWARDHAAELGRTYASELARRRRR